VASSADGAGFAFECADAKISIGASTWATCLSCGLRLVSISSLLPVHPSQLLNTYFFRRSSRVRDEKGSPGPSTEPKRALKMRWVMLLTFLPSGVCYVCWKSCLYLTAALGCHIAKSGTQPCIYQEMDLTGWLGAGSFFGMVGFVVSVPLAGIFLFEIWFRRLLAKYSKA